MKRELLNRKLIPVIVTGIFVLCFAESSFSQKDTITVLLRGEYKKRETFGIRYKNQEGLKIFGYSNHTDSIKIIIDTAQVEFEYLDIRLYRKRWFGWDSVKKLFIYDPRNRYIHVYHHYHPGITRREFFEVFYLDFYKSLYPLHCVKE